MKHLHPTVRVLICLIGLTMSFGLVSGCAAPNPQKSAECSRLLSVAESELDAAKAKGFSSSVSLTKAAALISAAKIQLQFNKYPNCIEKAKRARIYIRIAQTENK